MVSIVTLTNKEATNICMLLHKAKFFHITFDFNDCREFEIYYNMLAKRIQESVLHEKEQLNKIE